ncbi:hypothetical protein J6590_061871 [Homalodisca vitripennis]|nr:hypothetical protein J6590_061871 [Homalodisca vitripennis]
MLVTELRIAVKLQSLKYKVITTTAINKSSELDPSHDPVAGTQRALFSAYDCRRDLTSSLPSPLPGSKQKQVFANSDGSHGQYVVSAVATMPLLTRSSDEGEGDTGHSEHDELGDMRVKDQEDEGIDLKDEPSTPELEAKDPTRDFLLPPELELRTYGVWARQTIPRGTRFGPYLGKWTTERPSDPQAFWEVKSGDPKDRGVFIQCPVDGNLPESESQKTQ